ncbi:MAG: iron-containing alcohol dehydrogenase family protein [Hyphomicrobiaceae bacterium]
MVQFFHLPTEVIAGAGTVSRLGTLAGRFGPRVILVTDSFLATTPAFHKVRKSLVDARAEVAIITGAKPEPTTGDVAAIMKELGAANVDLAVAFGGGSVMDVTKAICILLKNEGPIERYDGTGVYTNPPVPLIAIPTTAGTGSEVSASLNVTDTQGNAKLSVRHRWNRPAVAILDPEMMAGIPLRVALFPAIDAVTHALEAYVSRGANSFSDAFATQALKLFGESFEPFLADTHALKHAESMLIGSAMAGVAFNIARTGYVHCLSRAIGGRIKIAHGHACALGLPTIVTFNATHAKSRLANAARLLLPASASSAKSEDQLVAQLADYFRELATCFKYESRLSSFGLTAADLPPMAAYATSLKYELWNPRPATEAELTGLLKEFL